MRTSMSAMGSVMLIFRNLLVKWEHRYPLAPASAGACGYQLALRRPGTSPRMVASRSLLRARPNLEYTPRERPVSSQRLRTRDGEESRGSFCSLVTASIFSSYEAVALAIVAFSVARLAACFFTSFFRLMSRLTIEVLAIVLGPVSVAEREAEGREQRLGFRVGLGGRGDRDVHAAH